MPNWCGNRVTIKGNRKTLQEICSKAIKEVDGEIVSRFSFNNFFPIPKVNLPKGFSATIWCSQNWGTNRDCFFESLSGNHTILSKNRVLTDQESLQEDEIELLFSTAWASPIKFFERLSEKYDIEVIMEFIEPGMGFGGYQTIVNGETEFSDDYTKGSNSYNLLMEKFIEEGVAIG